jgi:hypothetical protein
MSTDRMPWLRLYTEIIDDEKIRLLAFEDRWHYIALLCCKRAGMLDAGDTPSMLCRKVAVKLGLQLRELEAMAERLAEVGLIESATFQPLGWEDRQFKSDTDASARDRKRRQREREKNQTPTNNVTESRVTVTNVTRTDTDTDTDTEAEKKQASREISTSTATPTEAGRACKAMREAGCMTTNPSHPDLIAALAEGVTPEALADTVREALHLGKPKPFPWAIATARGRQEEGAKPMTGANNANHPQRSRLGLADRNPRPAFDDDGAIIGQAVRVHA